MGPRTLAAHTVPTLTNAAERAGRAIPRVVAMFPIGVTADRDAAHQRVAKLFQIYGQLPSYRAMLDREGATTAADLAILGDEAEITDRVGALKNLGVTDLAAVPVGGRPDEVERTDALLQNLVTEVA